MTDDETPRMVRPLPHPPVRLPSSIYKIMEPHSTSSSSKSDAHFYRSRNAKLMRVTKTAMDLESNKTLKASEDSKKIEPTMSSDSTTKCQEFMKMVQRIQELEEKMKKLVQGQHVEQTVVHDQRKSKQQDKVMVVKKEILANLLMDQSEMSLVTASGDQRAKIKRIQLSNVTTQTSKLQLQEKLSRSAACPIPRVPQTELEGLYSESTSSVEKKFRKFYPTEEFSPLETGRSIQELKTQVVEDLGVRDVLDATSFSRRTPGGASDVAETDLESEETCGYLKGRCPEDSETEEESYSLLSPLCFRRRASARPKENIPRSTYPIPPPRPNRHY
ncbi:unnamed protein product [Cyprideis torosa]|uniref:Uncharacterized protein n=1 Tax=Cyprideis torosa TaxID=163714 RepID=A0A7R8WGQ3_9CRUS|nr:unnamed protein product [Cyprideis torosa]CAG0893237.1 unnamed protein product [Cyprideis torosa]